MTSFQLTRLVVLREFATSLGAALRCMTADSDPAAVLSAAGNNAAASISMALECAREGV